MKKILYLFLILFTACEPENYFITGVLSPEDDSKVAVLFDYKTGEEMYTAEVIGGVFSFSGNVRKPMVVGLIMEGEQYDYKSGKQKKGRIISSEEKDLTEIIFILEEGDISVDISSQYISGTLLNNALENFKSELIMLEDDLQAEIENIMSSAELDEKQKEEKIKELNKGILDYRDELVESYLANYPELSIIFE